MDADSPMGMTIYNNKNSIFVDKNSIFIIVFTFPSSMFSFHSSLCIFFNHQKVEMLTNVISDNAY